MGVAFHLPRWLRRKKVAVHVFITFAATSKGATKACALCPRLRLLAPHTAKCAPRVRGRIAVRTFTHFHSGNEAIIQN